MKASLQLSAETVIYIIIGLVVLGSVIAFFLKFFNFP
jgi:hypothetical protein